MFKEAGLEPRVVASPAGALMELAPAERRERVAVLSVGQAESHLAFVGGDTLRSARTLRFGMTKLEQSIAKNLGVASEDAESFWRRIGLGEGDGTIATGDVVRIQHAVQCCSERSGIASLYDS